MVPQGTAGPWSIWGRGPEVSFLGSLTPGAKSSGAVADRPAKIVAASQMVASILEALNLPGTLGLNSSERQTLDLPERGQTMVVSRLVLRNCPAWAGVAMSVLEGGRGSPLLSSTPSRSRNGVRWQEA